MQPHIPTLFLVLVVVSFVFAGAIAIVGFNRNKALMLWAGALMLHGMAYVLFSLRGVISDFVSIVVANVALTAIFSLFSEGLFLFLRRPAPRWPIWIPLPVTVLGFTWLIDDYLSRVLFGSLVFGYQGLLMAVLMVRHWRQVVGRGKYVFVGSALLIGLVFLVKFVFAMTGHVSSSGFTVSNPLNTLSYMVGICTIILMATGLLLMTWERDEMSILESEARLRTLFEESSDAVLILDEHGLVDCNAAAVRLFGCRSKADLLALSPGAFSAHAESSAALVERVERVLREGGHDRFDWDHKRMDTSATFPAEVLLDAARIDGRNVLQAVVRDITERKSMQFELESRVAARTSELATARAEAESANAVKTRFMANVSHEMRTPMSGILGFAELGKLHASERSGVQLESYFEAILTSAHRLNRLIESLIALAQDAWNEQSGIAETDLQPVELEALVMQCIGQSEAVAVARNQRIEFDNQSTGIIVAGDRQRLRHVLEHLLGNALRYSPDHAVVKVVMQLLDESSGPARQVSIQFIDEGCGVPEKEMQAIFEPFYESSRTATGAGGTGLGLPLCKSIILRHGGLLSVRNRAEGGAIFEIALPLH